MNNISKKLTLGVLAMSGLLMGTMGTTHAQSTGTDVYLTLTGGDITIEATGSVNMGTIPISTVDTPVEYSFSSGSNEYFVVQDLKGADAGYYTTIQASNLSGNNGSFIPASNLSLKVDPMQIFLLAGSANSNITFGPSISTAYTLIDSAVVFFKRDTAANNGLTGRYGILPTLRVLVPAFQAVGIYKSTITLTLFEN